MKPTLYYSMPSNYQQNINTALRDLSTKKTISSALFVCNVLLEYMGIETKSVEDIELSKLKLPNAERYDRWFDQHPHFRGNRACFDVTSKNPLLEAKFYALQKRSKLFIAGAVNFTPNFEDRDYTRNDPNMKVGIDFFLTPEKDSVIVVLSNKCALRLVELSGRLTNTQVEIFNLWHDIAKKIEDKNAFHLSMWESFKLSSLNKKFYTGISDSFTSLTQHLRGTGVDQQLANQFANRLHGRLLFLWFLRKKSIINESKGYFTLGDQNDTEYYQDTLSTLFFNILNNEDHKDIDLITPYLNGGLFDQNSDGEYWNTHKPTFPTGFFSTLYDHFNSFNFTTDESTPEYEQIAIDPEMLGRIFESFLATLTTETGAQAKKANGAFYTPREIVSYMSRESLRQYLYTALGSNLFIKKSIDELLDRSDSEWALAGTNSKRDVVAKDDRERIMDALRAVKVLDPAVGSGAFPMGVLHKILSLFERLDPNFDAYETKLSILKNNIYGVDIDPTAIEIARLRAWLSIIVDVEDTRKIKPLPNLDFKFVCANSLIGLDKGPDSLTSDRDLKPTLIRIRDEYYATSSKVKKEKLQKEYINLTHKGSLFDTEETRQLKSYQPFETGKSASFYDSELMHGVETFDVVIGNPPYVSIWKIEGKFKKYLEDKYLSAKGHYDLYVIFYERGISLLKEGGVLSYITSNKWMAQTYGKGIREIFLGHKIISLIDFSAYRVFESAMVDTQITLIQNIKQQGDYDLNIYFHNNENTPDFNKLGLSTINTSFFKLNEERNFKINLSQVKIDLLRKIQSVSIKVDDILYTSKGAELHSTVNKLKKELYIKDHFSNGLKKYIEGKFFDRYAVIEVKYLSYEPEKHKAPVFPELFEAEKIIVKNIVGRTGIQAILDTQGLYNNDAIINAAPYYVLQDLKYRQLKSVFTDEKILNSKKYSLKYILGVLNSRITSWYFSEVFSNGLHFYPRHLREMLIPRLDSSKQMKFSTQVESLVEEIIKLKKIDPKTDTKDFEEQIDTLVYKLYGLNVDEIKIIEKSV